jgi:antibiotic biosynthesis monooxygenase (ABM) superfamily enzyme
MTTIAATPTRNENTATATMDGPATPAALAAPAAPSVHVRAVLTWLSVFPIVAVGLTLLGPVTVGWPPALRAFVLSLVVVPTTVYLVQPRLLKAYNRLAAQRRR